MQSMLNMVKKAVNFLILLPIYGYQYVISPWLFPSCNFRPTCSEYSKLAIAKHGVIFGAYLSLRRILKCTPWKAWEYDPVPKDKKWMKK